MNAGNVETRLTDCCLAVWGKGKKKGNEGNPDKEEGRLKMKRGRRAGIFEAGSEKVRV